MAESRSSVPPPFSPRAARERAMQALYQWQLTGQPATAIMAQYLPSDAETDEATLDAADRELEQALDMLHVDAALFSTLLTGVLERLEDWDAQLDTHLDRPAVQLDPTERACLRLGCFELNERIEVPYRVVINEYVNLAKRFGAQGSYKYVNGILDQVARAHPLRLAEITAGAGRGSSARGRSARRRRGA